MPAALDTSRIQPGSGEPEPWTPKPLGWHLLFSDRLLWLSLGISFIAHLIILAPHYGIHLPERSDRSMNVTFRAASQPVLGSGPEKMERRTSVERGKPSTSRVQTPPAPSAISPAASSTATAVTAKSVAGSSGSENMASVGHGRRITLTPNMKDYRYSQYLSDWRLKVERVGAMNYPEEARGKFFGSLVLSVALRPDGNVDRIIVVRSSGNKVLDDAAKRIVMMASPFAPFPPDIRQETDYLDITRTWTFTRGDALETR
jgi:TonB family protein